MINSKTISIVIPAKNEEDSLGLLLTDLRRVVFNLETYSFEIIVVDDHSSDRTVEVALRNGVTVVYNKGKPGKGNALICGFKEAAGEIIVMMDADYSHRAEDIPVILRPFENGAGLVIGSRIYGGSQEYTRIRAFGNLILTFIFGFLHNRYLSDALNGFKAFRSEIFKNFNYTSSNFEIEIELLVNALRLGMKIVEVPSHERIRKGGKAKSKVVKDGFRFLSRIILEKIKLKLAKKQLVVK